MIPRVSLVVLSYNRPRWLREAVDSALANRPDELILVDDGSDFDPRPYAAWDAMVIGDPLTVEERLRTARLGWLINAALDAATGDVVAYLCDDDLLAPGWLDAVRQHFATDPAHHMVRGNWLQFHDGDPLSSAVVCPMSGFWMTTGNFAHRLDCYREEGACWDEGTVACHDAMFLHRYGATAPHLVHDPFHVPYLDVVAGYRRLHPYNALNYVMGIAEYAPNAPELFKDGWLEAAR